MKLDTPGESMEYPVLLRICQDLALTDLVTYSRHIPARQWRYSVQMLKVEMSSQTDFGRRENLIPSTSWT